MWRSRDRLMLRTRLRSSERGSEDACLFCRLAALIISDAVLGVLDISRLQRTSLSSQGENQTLSIAHSTRNKHECILKSNPHGIKVIRDLQSASPLSPSRTTHSTIHRPFLTTAQPRSRHRNVTCSPLNTGNNRPSFQASLIRRCSPTRRSRLHTQAFPNKDCQVFSFSLHPQITLYKMGFFNL